MKRSELDRLVNRALVRGVEEVSYRDPRPNELDKAGIAAPQASSAPNGNPYAWRGLLPAAAVAAAFAAAGIAAALSPSGRGELASAICEALPENPAAALVNSLFGEP